MELLKREFALHRTRSVMLKRIVFSIIGFTVLSTILAFALGRYQAQDMLLMLPVLTLFGGIAMAYSPKHKALVAELVALKDAAVLEHLIQAAHHPETNVKAMAEAALPEVLGVWLSRGDFELGGEARFQLYRLLDPKRPVSLAQAVLITIHSVGGSEALTYLDKFRESVRRESGPKWSQLETKSLQVSCDVRIRVAKTIIESATTDAQITEQMRA